MKRDTTKPRIYSRVIKTPLQAIASFDVEPRNYKKDHCDENKYNISHLTAPKN